MNNDDVETIDNCPKSLAAWKREVEKLRAQLEAERQRADDLVLHVNTQANMREKAEKERDGVVKNYNRVTDERNSALYEVAALKSKLANPVVLPAGYSARDGHPFHEGERNVMIPNKHGDWLSRFDVEHAIQVAGYLIKDVNQ